MEEEKKKQTNAKTKNSTWPHPPPPPIFTFGFNFSSTSLFCPLLSFHLSGFLYFFRACYAVVTWTPCYMPPLAFPFNVFGAYSIRFHRETLERKRERETGVEKRRGKFLSRERERKRTEPGGAWSTIRHTRFSFSLERDVGKREAIEIRKGRNSLEVFVESLVESF